MKKNNIKIGFAGLSHLGLCSMIANANLGIQTYGFDFDKNRVEKYNDFKLDIKEPKLLNLLKKNNNLIKMDNKIKILSDCNLIYISNDVATDKNGNSNLSLVNKYIIEVKKIIKKKSALIILCQVPPGFTRKNISKKIDLYYQVETLIFGKAIQRATTPERIIIGKTNKDSNLNLYYKNYLNLFKCPKIFMNYESAELAKIAINIMLISSITSSNVLSNIASNVNGDWNDITKAIKLDKRIGKYSYLRPSLGLSGGNLERDLVSIKKISLKNNVNSNLFDSFLLNSQSQKNWILLLLKKLNINLEYKICFLGLTYKENTHSIKNSNAIHSILKLKRFKINAYDPVINSLDISKNLSVKHNLFEAVKGCEVLIITTPWSEFFNLKIKYLNNSDIKILIDPYGVLYDQKNNMKFKYFTIGFD